MRKLFSVLAASAVFALPAQAATVLSDNFDGENGGATAQNYAGFANFNVGDGTVDIIANGFAGLSCAGGSGSCVDLDGSSSDGGTLTTKLSYGFNAGDRVTLQIDLSGSQRGGGADEFSFGFNTSVATTFQNVVVENALAPGSVAVGNLGPGLFLGSGRPSGGQPLVASNEPFTRYSISFTAGNAGSLTAFVATASADNVGPILDNFVLSIGPVAPGVPEPATWAMMIGGFALAGAVARRRRTFAIA